MGTKSTVYFTDASLKILVDIHRQTGKSNSDIVNDALHFYSDMDNRLREVVDASVQTALKRRNEDIKKIVEEVARDIFYVDDSGEIIMKEAK